MFLRMGTHASHFSSQICYHFLLRSAKFFTNPANFSPILLPQPPAAVNKNFWTHENFSLDSMTAV